MSALQKNFTAGIIFLNRNSSTALVDQCTNPDEYFKDFTSFLSVRIVFGFIYVCIFIFGFVGNWSVVLKVAVKKKLHTTRNIFLIGLMAADILLCLTAVPVTPVVIMIKQWILGKVLCKIIPMSQAMSVVVTSFCLTAIAVDKFAHIVHYGSAPWTARLSVLALTIIWVSATSINVPLLLSFQLNDGSQYNESYGVLLCGHFCTENGWASDEYRRVYGTVVMSVQFIIPLIIISFCYSRILSKVGRDMIVQNKKFSDSLSEVQRLDGINKRRQVNYILILMVVAFVCAWTPLTILNILHDYDLVPEVVRTQYYFWFLSAHSIAMTTVIWNPVLFFWLTITKRKKSNSAISGAANPATWWSFFTSPFRFRRNDKRSTTASTCSMSFDNGSIYRMKTPGRSLSSFSESAITDEVALGHHPPDKWGNGRRKLGRTDTNNDICLRSFVLKHNASKLSRCSYRDKNLPKSQQISAMPLRRRHYLNDSIRGHPKTQWQVEVARRKSKSLVSFKESHSQIIVNNCD